MTKPLTHHSSFGFSSFLRHWEFVIRHSLNQPDRHWITIELSLTRLNRRNDHQHQVQNVQDCQEDKADQNQAKDASNHVIDQHRYLKVERFPSVFVDLRRIATLSQPNDQRTKNMPSPWHKESGQCSGVTKHVPRPYVSGRSRCFHIESFAC
jgi:hypothetical protein